MSRQPSVWSFNDVVRWLEESASTSRRLPPVQVQGYFNVWPVFVRTEYERLACEDAPRYRFPPSPDAIEQMLQTMRWMQWLDVEQRHLVWMRAKRYGWREIGIRFACNRTTAWRNWKLSIEVVVEQLNASMKWC